ncbi:unnamed protein product [Caenorhabditis bovis]|uniref:BTB domain-containing protein n=1 Tax=Caenorhabditis bovis TaxID=2654633 RepID=A0A8S1EGH4_9PELO|nr:unnamed protein product [Caenorhabditis bovis]
MEDDQEYVKLNVGGALFQTTLATLKKQDTMLRAMFSGRMQVKRDDQGWVHIDRNGRHFGLILDYLRDGSVPLPDCKMEVEQIRNEAIFFLVQGLQSECEEWIQQQTLKAAHRDDSVCSIMTVTSKEEADRVIATSNKPTIKLLLNRHNNKFSYTAQADDHFMKNLELFERLAVKFHHRIFFVKDNGYDSPEVCQWQFYGDGVLRGQVCCTSIVYAPDRKQTKMIHAIARRTLSNCRGIVSRLSSTFSKLPEFEEEYYEDHLEESTTQQIEKITPSTSSDSNLENVVKTLNDQKAKDVVVVDTNHLLSPYNYQIVCSAFNSRQASAISENMRSLLKNEGTIPTAHAKTISRKSNGWYICNLDDIQVHVMSEECRERYALEMLWMEDEQISEEVEAENDYLIPKPKESS